MARHAREVGGPALRAMTFHERADRLKALASYLNDRKTPLYELALDTGATRRDNLIDIDGGIGTCSPMPLAGAVNCRASASSSMATSKPCRRRGSFLGLHIRTPLTGVAVQINAFNFPSGACWKSSRRRSWRACR